ncbi:MAG TPA: MFS transporter [Dehalococcoidia bacterium]|nr:MFS transporter [Dehalococcoidia bacterium]
MTDDDGPARRGIWARVGVIGVAGYHADRVLDEAQVQVFRVLWLFLPHPSVARRPQFQHLLASRFLSESGQQALAFGALVAVAREGGTALEVALLGVAAIIPPAVLGMYGGVVADTLPARIALAGAYVGQGALCLGVPLLLDTSSIIVLVVLILAVNTLGQVSAPTEQAVVPLVATEEQLASAAALLNLVVAVGQGFATALLAPILVKVFGVEAVIYVAGGLLMLAATRVFDLPVGERAWQMRLPPWQVRLREAARWLVRHPAVGTMIVVSVLAGTVNVVLVTLAPRYVEEVLDSDAANTAYVFAPAALGVVMALVSVPWIVRAVGERVAALVGLFAAAGSLTMLGLVSDLTEVVDPVNPLRVVGLLGIEMRESVRTAGLFAIPLAFGVSLTATSVQTYINRRVPIAYQGRTFALQGALRNGAAIIPLLALGAAASELGTETVLLTSPVLLLVIGYLLIIVSFQVSGLQAPSHLEVAESFWEEPESHRRAVEEGEKRPGPGGGDRDPAG